MLGNDLVDLSKAKRECDWRREGYLEKIFTPIEIKQITRSADADTMVWLLWSMKESAYKIVNRSTGLRFYAPRLFHCCVKLQEDWAYGEVNYNNQIYLTQSSINNRIIHTIARDVKFGNAKPPQNFFEKVKVFQQTFTSNYLDTFNNQADPFLLIKKNGIPEMINKISGEIHVASISHHGEHLAIVHL